MVAWYWWQQWCWNDDISCSTLVVFSDFEKRLRTNNYHKEESPVPDPLPLLLLLLVLLLLLLVESRHPCGNRILKSPASFTSPTLSEPLGIRWFCYHGYISQYIFLVCLPSSSYSPSLSTTLTYMGDRQEQWSQCWEEHLILYLIRFWGNDGGRNRTGRTTLTRRKSLNNLLDMCAKNVISTWRICTSPLREWTAKQWEGFLQNLGNLSWYSLQTVYSLWNWEFRIKHITPPPLLSQCLCE